MISGDTRRAVADAVADFLFGRPEVSCGGIKSSDHRMCQCKLSGPVPVQTCPFCGGEQSCMLCYDCPNCNLRELAKTV